MCSVNRMLLYLLQWVTWVLLFANFSKAWTPQSAPGKSIRTTIRPTTRPNIVVSGHENYGKPLVLLGAVSSDIETEVIQSQSSDPTTGWEEIGRALELVGITWSEWLSPLGQGLLPPDNQNPSSWEDFWELSLKEENSREILVAELFTRYLERLGATYVKFGQALASRPDIVPRSLAVALSKLQDDMDVLDSEKQYIQTPYPVKLATAEGVREVLRNEYRAAMGNASNTTNELVAFRDLDEMEEFLTTLSEEPVAAASIGVVYSGSLPGTGEKVAIKIQRPNVKEIVQKDAWLLRRAAKIIESIPSPSGKSDNSNEPNRLVQTDITGAVEEFMCRLEEELDLLI